MKELDAILSRFKENIKTAKYASEIHAARDQCHGEIDMLRSMLEMKRERRQIDAAWESEPLEVCGE